jgi:hypothetical protein
VARNGVTPDVYVQIPAYRDRELSATLLDLYENATRPARLRTRVVWQHAPGEALDPLVADLPGLELVPFPHIESRGCNWARAQLQDAWNGERYTLLLDSHHRFVPGWDDVMVGMYEDLRARGVAKPLLTAYLPPYDPARDRASWQRKAYKIYPMSRDDGVLTRLTSHPMLPGLPGPVEAEFLSLHFVFADGAFNRTVRFDPDIYFFGDEVLTGLRAFTWGYDLFHPHVVVGWHLYDRATRVTHWADHALWHEQQAASLAKLRTLFAGAPTELLGPHRTVAAYEDWIMAPLVETA